MLDLLRQILGRRAGKLDLAPLRQRFGDALQLHTPAQALDVAQALCRLALPRLLPATSVAEEGANLLIGFLADLPQPHVDAIRAVAAFAPTAPRAWIEPRMDAYVALGSTVQDVWAHLMGPEAQDDDAIASALLSHAAAAALDFGCGAGHFAHLLARAGTPVDGLEPDPLKQAFFAYRAHASGLAHLMRLHPQREHYDLVLALNVLDHMEDPTPALDAFRAVLPPGGVLCTLAAFPADGWHQCDPVVVERCARTLWYDYTLSDAPAGLPPWMDCWVRRASPARPPSRTSVPRLNPGSFFQPRDGGEVLLAAHRFYARAMSLDADTATLCGRFDGTAGLGALAETAEVDEDDLLGLCVALQRAGHLHWADDHPRQASVARDAAARTLAASV